jgi:predicted nucleotide-binding protein
VWHGCTGTVHAHVRIGQIVVGIRIAGLQFERLAAAMNRLLAVAHPSVDGSQQKPATQEGRLYPYRGLVTFAGLRQNALAQERLPEDVRQYETVPVFFQRRPAEGNSIIDTLEPRHATCPILR